MDVQKGSNLDLRQLLRRQRPETAVLRLARLAAMIQGCVKRSRGFKHIDKLLKRFRMPGRSVHCFKSCSQKLLQQAKHATRAAAKATAAVRGSSMYAWIMSRAKFELGKPCVSQTGGMHFKQPRAFPLLIYGTKASPPGTIGKEA